jgi:hypothetical protein
MSKRGGLPAAPPPPDTKRRPLPSEAEVAQVAKTSEKCQKLTHAVQQITATCYNPRLTAKHYGTPQSTTSCGLS